MTPLNRNAALSLAATGLRVFPCNPDKTPTIKDWEHNATSSALQIEAKWQSNPHLLPAIPVGAFHLVVIDADRKNGVDGVAAFTSLCSQLSIDLNSTLVIETPSGGFHFYFRTDAPYGNSRGSLPDGIDVRGIGGYVIAPGATLPDGRAYRIVQSSFDAIASLPDALAALLTEKKITHFAKGTEGRNTADRVLGSTAFKDFSRMTLVAAKDETSNRRVFAKAKSNNSSDTGGLSYSIEVVTLAAGIRATRIAWGESSEGSSRAILAEIESEGEEKTQLDAAKRFLIGTLGVNPIPSKELFDNARETLGISNNTLRRAQKELGIIATKTGFAGGWVWALPSLNS